MINLLPSDLKQEYRYARRNTHMARWTGVFLLSLVGLVVIIFGGLLYMDHFTHTYTKRVDAINAELEKQDYTGAEKQVATIASNLNLMVKVLSQEVLFSELLSKLSSVIPENAILTNLNIQQTSGGIDITAHTDDYATATQLQVNLADPSNQIFARADIVSITCGNSTDTTYPCTVIIRALFAQQNPFLFIKDDHKATS